MISSKVPEIVHLPKIEDPRGSLTVIEQMNHIPFEIKSVYIMNNSCDGSPTWHRAEGDMFIVVLSKTLTGTKTKTRTKTQTKSETFLLDTLYHGLLMPEGTMFRMMDINDDACVLMLSNSDNDIQGCIRIDDRVGYDVKRVFYTYDVPDGEDRGAHAHKECRQYLVAVNGSFDVTVDDGLTKHTVRLDSLMDGVEISPGVWASEENYTSGSICLVLTSDVYDENDYIRNYDEFKDFCCIKSKK